MKASSWPLLLPLLTLGFGCFGEFDGSEKEEEYRDRGDFLLEWGKDAGYEVHAEWSIANMSYEEEYLNDNFKLPHDISITHKVCGDPNAFWDGSGITMCYEMLDVVAEVFGLISNELSDEEYNQLVYDSWVFILYHELGHALIDTYDLPVPGREEDAVDAFSVVILVQGGVPDTVVSAALFWLLLEESQGGAPNFADEHSMNLQRMYNLLCWVYGSAPREYSWLPEVFPDMQDRIAGGRCEQEYADQEDAWNELLRPYKF